MALEVSQTQVRSILTRTSGFLRTVTSHSLQPYRGCAYGSSLCGVGCYVRHNGLLTRGRPWGSFLEVRVNAADAYERQVDAERLWAQRSGAFSVFLSSSTDPFVPQERRFGVTRAVLETMHQSPPDELILQTHSHLVADYTDLLVDLASSCDLRVHLSIESDRDRLPGLPPPASSKKSNNTSPVGPIPTRSTRRSAQARWPGRHCTAKRQQPNCCCNKEPRSTVKPGTAVPPYTRPLFSDAQRPRRY